MKSLFIRIWKTIQLWIEVDGSFVSAAVAFYAALAVFPLILVLMSIFGWLLASSSYVQDWETRLLEFVANESSQHLADQVGAQLQQIQAGASISGPISIVTLLLISVALFANLERAFHRIWQTQLDPAGILVNLKRILFHRLRAFLMLLGIVLIVALNFGSNIAIEMIAQYVGDWVASERVWRWIHTGASVLLNALMFTAIYQTVPREKVRWWHAVQGGLLTAILWELGRFLLATLVVSERYNAFGVVGVFLALMLWLFYGMNVILFGAVFVRVTSHKTEER